VVFINCCNQPEKDGVLLACCLVTGLLAGFSSFKALPSF
jgi:hypothetical protein